MSNMSYCRFENTYYDLKDCSDNLLERDDLSATEVKYRRLLIKTCQRIVENAEEAGLLEEAKP